MKIISYKLHRPVFLFLLAFSTFLDYYSGLKIEQASTPGKSKFWLILSIGINLGFLGFFKYYNFFLDNINIILHALHIATNSIPLLDIILPLGLSFHTFQAMSYTIEVYRGNQKPPSE